MRDSWKQFTRRKFIWIAGATTLSTAVLKGCATHSTATSDQRNTSENNAQSSGVSRSVSGNDDAQLYEAAKQEGKLVYYTVFFNQDVVNEIGAAFTKKYPGIQFEGTRKTAGPLFQQLNQELQSGIRNCDVFGTTDIAQMVKLREQGKLLQYEPAGKDRLLSEFRNLSPENYYQAGALIPIVIGCNTQKIPIAEVPKSWKELLDPKYKDKIATGSGAASGQIGTWALALDQKYGWDNYFPQFNNLNPKLGQSVNDAVSDVVSGERAIGVVTLGQMLTAKKKGNPVDVVYPSEGAVVIVGSIGILQDAPRPHVAKLFMNFLASREYAEVVAKYSEQPLRSDVSVANAKPLKEMNPLIPTAANIVETIPQIKRKWREQFGA